MMHSLRHAALVGLAMFAVSGPVWAQHTAKPNATKSSTAATAKGGSQSAAGAEYSTETAAKSHCPSDTVVWVNKSSKIFHFSGTPDYGHSKRGAYMCEKQATAAHFRAAKNEKHP